MFVLSLWFFWVSRTGRQRERLILPTLYPSGIICEQQLTHIDKQRRQRGAWNGMNRFLDDGGSTERGRERERGLSCPPFPNLLLYPPYCLLPPPFLPPDYPLHSLPSLCILLVSHCKFSLISALPHYFMFFPPSQLLSQRQSYMKIREKEVETERH